jgi:histidine triad (HIT) family protein
MDCIFCKIIARGEVPSTQVYEDREVYAFLDINPVNLGHTLVVPKKHYKTLFEIPDGELGTLGVCVKKIASAVKTALSADGINVSMNNGSAAGQIVHHAHIHIIPRHEKDGFKHWQGRRGYINDEEKEKTAAKIKSAL